jgi:hypothetical protein
MGGLDDDEDMEAFALQGLGGFSDPIAPMKNVASNMKRQSSRLTS